MIHRYILIIFLFLSACVSYDAHDTSKASGSFGLAKQLEDDERYEESLLQYKDVKNRFPYSRFSVESELRVAEIQFKKEAFAEAQSSYQLFKELHPKHKKIDYVTFQIGESVYKQLPSTIDRDLGIAPGAIQEFKVVLRDYPKSEFAAKAKGRIQDIYKKLAEKELYIADFYYRTDKWQNALIRYEKYLKLFPQHDQRPRAMLQAGYAADKFGDPSKKNLLFRKLIQDYPSSKEAGTAKDAL